MTDVLIRRGDLDIDMYRGKTIGRYREEMAIFKPGREAWTRSFLRSPQKEPTLLTP